MRPYANRDVHRRVWPGIARPNGRTLELEPDEEAELDLPSDFTDPHLRPVMRRPRREAVPADAPPKES